MNGGSSLLEHVDVALMFAMQDQELNRLVIQSTSIMSDLQRMKSAFQETLFELELKTFSL